METTLTQGHGSFLATRRFIQIPGPNPIVARGTMGEWDEAYIEGGDIFKDYHQGLGTYYLYYHGHALKGPQRPGPGYRIGAATATHPLGPFRKAPQNPMLDLGSEGSWDDRHVACPSIVKEGLDKYYMWYSGMGSSKEHSRWSIGLATASGPLGPWEKHEDNPIIKDFGYVGGVVKVQGNYYLYTEHPIGSTGPDYGPFSLATAESPEGPWTKWEGNPVLAPEGWGGWDDGGYSEAKVVYRDGVFHVFYGAAKLHPTRIRSLESIGYAFSYDGHHFTKHVDNPVALRERNPDASAFSEVKCLIEPPFVYLYHTLRYLSSTEPHAEDLGVQILATSRPFRLTMPVLHRDTLAAKMFSTLDECPPISLEHISHLSLTVECTYHADAKGGMRVHVRSSWDGRNYDTVDRQTFDLDCIAGETVRKTVAVSADVQFIKVLVENLDHTQNIADLAITATLGG